MHHLTTLLLKLPRNTEVTPEAAQTFLAALTQINSVGFLQRLFGARSQALSLEIVQINQQIQFLVTCDTALVSFVKTQIQSNYPLARPPTDLKCRDEGQAPRIGLPLASLAGTTNGGDAF